MNKKVIGIIVAVVVIIAIIVGIVLSKGGNGSSNTSGKGLELTYDFSHMNNKVYSIKSKLNSDDKITELEEGETNSARIENEKENYVLDITLDTEAKEAYEQFKTSAKEDNEIFKEVKFGKYEGYYSGDEEDIFGYILLDGSDETFNAYLNFDLYLYDENIEGNDVQSIYNSSNIQNILNNIEFKSK